MRTIPEVLQESNLSRNRIRKLIDALILDLQTTRTLRFLAVASLLFFLATAFRAGWQRDETDFPNYYTAAGLLREQEPLRKYYDWTWFARRMNHSGVERLGAYAAQTPLTMLPMVPLAGFPVQRAKQIWLLCNLAFLAVMIWMLSQITGLRAELIWLLTFCGYFSLYANFLLGQYYVFLLFLLTLTFYLLWRGRGWASGFTAGLAFALKLYGGPFLIYFIATRKWKAAAGMLGAIIVAAGVAIALFGWPDVRYYLLYVLPRSLEGGSIDPYNARNQTLSTLLRLWFLREPQLNSHPLWDAPRLFFFLSTFVSLAILLFAYLGAREGNNLQGNFGWFSITIVLLSTSIGSYTFIVLLLAVVLLLRDRPVWQAWYLVVSYVMLTLPLHWAWLFPKLCILLTLFIAVGWERWRRLPSKIVAPMTVLVVVCATLNACSKIGSYEMEPGRHLEQLRTRNDSLFSSSPVITTAGLFFQSMGKDRYIVRWLHENQAEDIPFEGHAFHPTGLPDGSIVVELVRHGVSTMVRFDPATRGLAPSSIPVPASDTISALSPDGKWLAFTSDEPEARHLWLRNLETGQILRLAGGNCDSSWPAWELSSRAIVFASDCGRALGLPALYRIQIPIHPHWASTPR